MQFDLRTKENVLHLLATFKVLAYMCHPHDLLARERMLATVQAGTGMGWLRAGPLCGEEFISQVIQNALRASVAASILLTRLQLSLLGYRQFTISSAIPLVRAHAVYGELKGYGRKNQQDSNCLIQPPISDTKMREAYAYYLPVVHFWAAILHGLQHKREDIWPGSNRTLPTFLGFADCILDMASSLPHPNRPGRFALMREEALHFLIPEHLRQHKQLRALPLVETQLKVLRASLA